MAFGFWLLAYVNSGSLFSCCMIIAHQFLVFCFLGFSLNSDSFYHNSILGALPNVCFLLFGLTFPAVSDSKCRGSCHALFLSLLPLQKLDDFFWIISCFPCENCIQSKGLGFVYFYFLLLYEFQFTVFICSCILYINCMNSYV